MDFLVTCKNEDQIKNEGDRVAKSLNVNFSNGQGQRLRSQLWDLAKILTHSSIYA